MNKLSIPYQALCTEYYELDKPTAPEDAVNCYIKYAEEARGPILEPMCGTGRFLIPLLERGYPITGFDSSPHMLEICRRKCEKKELSPHLHEASFANFSSSDLYQLIFIPSSSFCLLTSEQEIHQALHFIAAHLHSQGKFVFEVETLKAVGGQAGIWTGKWLNKSDGSKLVLSTLSHFDVSSKIETILCRYEQWEGNAIIQTEVEDFRLRLYDPLELEQLLAQHGFKVLHKWQPYTQVEVLTDHPIILYECMKL